MVGDASKLGWHPWILGIYPPPSLKLRVRTWKWMVGILVFFWGLANLQGRTVHPENCGRCLLYPFWWTRRLFSSRCVETKSWKSMWTAKVDFAKTRYFLDHCSLFGWQNFEGQGDGWESCFGWNRWHDTYSTHTWRKGAQSYPSSFGKETSESKNQWTRH